MKLKIREKILIITVVTVLLAVGANALFVSRMFEKEYSSALQSKMNVIADTLKLQIERLFKLGIPVENIEGFEDQCIDVVRRNEEVAYAMVVRMNGEILFHNHSAIQGTVINDKRLLDALKQNRQISCLSEIDGKMYYNSLVPIPNCPKGCIISIIVGYPLDIVNGKVQESLNYSFIVASVLLCVAAALVLVSLTISVTRPLHCLVTTIQKIRQNWDLNSRVTVRSSDEIGDLATNFNLMVEDLNRTTVSRDALVKEIADRKKAEEALQESSERLKAIFDTVQAGIFLIRADGYIIVDANQVAAEMIGLDKENIVGKECHRFICPAEKNNCNVTDLGQGVDNTERILLTDSGEEIPVLKTVIPITLSGKNYLLESFVDITERKNSERKLEELNNKLVQSNQQLQEFVYVASHDLREPIRKINSFGQMLAESMADRLNEEDRENLDFMIDGAGRMQQMIEALLTYSRVNTKGVESKRVDLNNVIEELQKLELSIKIEETNAKLTVPEPLPDVFTDPTQVRQLLQNLISNGLKYQKKDVVPEITIRASKENNGMVRVEVSDNGIGIKEDKYNDVFVMFRRLHSKTEYEGTGIGLAVCKRIVERHGGRIGVTSTYGEGSTFWFTIPSVKGKSKTEKEMPMEIGVG